MSTPLRLPRTPSTPPPLCDLWSAYDIARETYICIFFDEHICVLLSFFLFFDFSFFIQNDAPAVL